MGHPDPVPPFPSCEASGAKGFAEVVLMVPWTTRELEIMRERGYLGVKAVQRAIADECGNVRSARSIESRASRCHVSLRVQQVCPECGVVGLRLNRQSGLCPRCTELMHLEEEIAFNELLEQERAEVADEREIERIARERAAMRQRNSRLCRKYGLASRRDRRVDGNGG